jgi:hypothetical protein
MIGVLTFINALINTVSILEVRVNMRRQFLEQGLPRSLEKVRLSIDKSRGVHWEAVQQLQVQADLFEQMLSSDRREVVRNDADLSDVDSLFEHLKASAAEDNFSADLADILHLLMLIPGEMPEIGEKIWLNSKFILHKAILNENRENPDNYSVVPYEKLKSLLESKEKQNVSEKANKSKELEKKIEEQRKQLFELQTQQEKFIDELKGAHTREINEIKLQNSKESKENEKKWEEKLKGKKGSGDEEKKLKELQGEIEKLRKELADRPVIQVQGGGGSVPAAPNAPSGE